MKTELYQAKFVPSQIPEFVNPHITCEDDGTYLFEIDPEHPFVVELREKGEVVKNILESQFGFRSVKFVYSGEGFSFDIDRFTNPDAANSKKVNKKKKKFWEL